MDSFRPSRYTVLNSDNDNIYISKSLLNKLAQQQQQPQSQQSSTSESIPDGGSVPPSSAKKSSTPEFNTDTFHGSTGAAFATFGQPSSASSDSMPSSIDPEYIAKHAHFDSSANLYALRGEYERKLQQYQQIWRSRFDELEGLNEQLFKLNSEKFAKDVSRVDERYFKNSANVFFDGPCKSEESAVIQCLNSSGKKPLLCSEEVKQFSACIDKSRIDVLKR